MFFRILLIAVLALPATLVLAESPSSIDEEPDFDQTDMYYNAMIRSIDLDKTRWKTFSRSMDSGPWFYDSQSLKRHKSLVTCMVSVFPHPQKTALYAPVFSDHTKIRKIDFETEINCKTNTYRQAQIRVYGYYKELLAEHSNRNTFSSIKSGTTIDTLRNLLCGSGKKKNNQ